MYSVETVIYSTYDGWDSDEVRKPTRDLANATLVSSELTGQARGSHAPTWDLDHPAVLTVSDAGTVTCWIDAPLRPFWFRRFVRLAARYGLVAPEAQTATKADFTVQARQAQYARDIDRMLDTRMRDDILRRTGATLGTNVEEAIANSDAVGTRPFQDSFIRGPQMDNPWPLTLAVPATLVPSTRNHHLYVDARLPWKQYRSLLVAARRARVLEAGYVQMSVARTGTHLRAPWVSKDPI